MMTELEKIQADLDKKYEGQYVVFPKNTIKKEGNLLLNEMKALKHANGTGEEAIHRYRISAMRLVLLYGGFISEEEISALARKANVKLTTEEESFDKALIACNNHLTACGGSPEVLIEELKAELLEE